MTTKPAKPKVEPKPPKPTAPEPMRATLVDTSNAPPLSEMLACVACGNPRVGKCEACGN